MGYRQRLLYFVLCMIGGLALLTGCSLEDERDTCCSGAIIRFRYIEVGEDRFSNNIHSLRHFLYTGDGVFLREVPSNPYDMKNLYISNLEGGHYKLVTIGNATDDKTQLEGLEPFSSTIKDLKLRVRPKVTRDDVETTEYPNADNLFWNEGDFRVSPDTIEVVYTGALSNIHCHLSIRVYWHTMPRYDGLYVMRLTNVPTAYTLDPEKEHMKLLYKNYVPDDYYDKDVRLTFPGYEPETGTHSIGVYLFNLELKGEFVTLRYNYNQIPTFQLFHEGRAVTKPIDLMRAFRSWHWNPDEQTVQEYRIQMEIYDDGHIVVSHWLDSNVVDWQDGGRITN